MSTVTVCIATIPPREQLLKRALDSVRAQTRPADEIVVVVDEDGEGAGPTRNRAWRQATSEYTAMLDDDDQMLPFHLELAMSLLRATGADLCYPWFELVGPDGGIVEDDKLACPVNGELVSPLGVSFGPEQAEHLRQYAFIPSAVVVRRSLLEVIGGYPAHDTEEYEQFNHCEDWAMLNRLLDVGAKFVHAPARTWRLHLGAGTGGQVSPG